MASPIPIGKSDRVDFAALDYEGVEAPLEELPAPPVEDDPGDGLVVELGAGEDAVEPFDSPGLADEDESPPLVDDEVVPRESVR